EKFFALQAKSKLEPLVSEDAFYVQTRATGFIFGHILYFDTPTKIVNKDWFPQEITKIGMLNTLYQMYRLVQQKDDATDFIIKAVDFYGILTPKGFNPLEKILPSTSAANKLEKIIHDRVQ